MSQGGRDNEPYQTSTTNGRYSSQTYPTSNIHSSQPQHQSSYSHPVTSTDHTGTTHARYNDQSNVSHYQDARGYGYPPRSSVDTTALGNLAHASSLGQSSRAGTRDGSSLQQLINYNRSQYGNDYNSSQSHSPSHTSYDYSNQRADNRGSTSLQETNAPGTHPAETQTSTQYQYGQYTTNAGYSSSIPTHTIPEGSRRVSNGLGSQQGVSSEPGQKSQHYYANSQAPRPSSGQNYRTSSPALQPSQARQSPAVAPYRTPQVNSNSRSSATLQSQFSPDPSQSATPQQPHRTDQSAQLFRAGMQGKKQGSMSASVVKPGTQHSNASLRDSVKDRSNNHLRTTTASVEQIQTVDPSDVFNHYEYQRRQAAAEAERARKEAEAEEMRKASEAAAALKRVSEGQQMALPNGRVSSPESRKEEQMAAEMRLMIEKMRDYKAQDPSLFSQIWEQVKKTQPAGSVPAAPPLSAKDISGSTPVPTPVPQSRANGAITSSIERTADDDPSDKLPDLGRFPFQRRQRGAKSHSPARTPKGGSSKKKQNQTSQTDGSQSSPLVNSTMTKAGTIPASGNREVVYVSGTGPAAASSVVENMSYSNTAAPQPAGAPSLQTAAQPPHPQGTTTWPEHKKWDLAVAAKKTLLANPINSAQAKNITPEQILGFLNQNPSFEQLCCLIEAKGLIIERSHFARSLLEAIPDIGAGVRQRQQQAQQRTALAHRQPPAEISTSQAQGGEQTSQKQQPEGAPIAQMVPTTHALSKPANTTPSEEKPAVPLTKQEMARKRNISDIIDLSQLSDDEDIPNLARNLKPDEQRPQIVEDSQPPNTQANVDTPRPHSNLPHQTDAIPGPYIPAPFYPPPSYNPFYQPQPPTYNPSSSPYPPIPIGPPVMPPAASASTQQRELINFEDIIKPIDKHRAKKRSKYQSSTIVRDVLIAAGRHPTMQPLNYHLENLRTTFKHVNDMSDLSTFRWDLVDPGDPVDFAALDDKNVDVDDTNDADDEGTRDIVTQPSPHIQYTTNDGGTESSLTVASSSVTRHNFSNPPKLRGPKRRRVLDQPPSKVDKSWMGSGFDSFRVKPPNNILSPQTPQPTSNGVVPSTESSSGSTIRRRGRPPGSKNKNPPRPSNLRNTVVPTNGVAVVVPSPSPSIAETRGPGRPRKKSPRTSQQSSPIHRVYKCQWSHCPAELHNLETLRKHVMKHGDKYNEENSQFPCLWRGCGRPVHIDDEGDGDNEEVEHQPLRFATREIWAKHMDKRHIADYAWKLGDGPSTRSDSDMSDYVSDSAKRPVRPIITKEGSSNDPPPLTNGKPGKEYYKAHGITTELEKAQAFMEASEARRRKLGPGIDRVGATLVTESTRGLLDDEEVGELKKVENDEDT
ncbi:MAG: hypothetical protein Q9222_000615 [Ikaeria aurantiellina]